MKNLESGKSIFHTWKNHRIQKKGKSRWKIMELHKQIMEYSME